MAKFYGKIGFIDTVETEPSIYVDDINERYYYGNVNETTSKYIRQEINSNIDITTTISIISDAYANKNLENIRYVEYLGVKWKINSVNVRPPRLYLNLGGIYND